MMTVDEACAKVDAWGDNEAMTTGLHEIARVLRAEVGRLFTIRERAAEWKTARTIAIAEAETGSPIASESIRRLGKAECDLRDAVDLDRLDRPIVLPAELGDPV